MSCNAWIPSEGRCVGRLRILETGEDGVERGNASDGMDLIQQITMTSPMMASSLVTVENGSVLVRIAQSRRMVAYPQGQR